MEKKNRIEEALSIRNMKAVDLVEKSGVSKSSISSYMSQRWQPKQMALNKMAKVLGVSELWLAGYDVPMERPVEQIKSDRLAELIHRMRRDNNLCELFYLIANLTPDQLSIVSNMVSEFNKVTDQK